MTVRTDETVAAPGAGRTTLPAMAKLFFLFLLFKHITVVAMPATMDMQQSNATPPTTEPIMIPMVEETVVTAELSVQLDHAYQLELYYKF